MTDSKPLQGLWPHEASDAVIAQHLKARRRETKEVLGCIVCGAVASEIRCKPCDDKARKKAVRAVSRRSKIHPLIG